MCIFGDSVGYLICISEIQTERNYGGTVTYQGDIHQTETSVSQRGILYRGAVHGLYTQYMKPFKRILLEFWSAWSEIGSMNAFSFYDQYVIAIITQMHGSSHLLLTNMQTYMHRYITGNLNCQICGRLNYVWDGSSICL